MRNESMYWAWALKNSTVMVCWTVLAVYFGKWWIALFAALCFSSFERLTHGLNPDGTNKLEGEDEKADNEKQ